MLRTKDVYRILEVSKDKPMIRLLIVLLLSLVVSGCATPICHTQ